MVSVLVVPVAWIQWAVGIRRGTRCRGDCRTTGDRDALNLLEVHDVAYLESGRKPAIEEDAQTDSHVEVNEIIPVELSVIRINDRYGSRPNKADAAIDVRVVVENEVAEPSKFPVHRDVREIEVPAHLVFIQRDRDARRPTILEVEVRVRVEALVPVPSDADCQNLRDVVVEREAWCVVANELIVQRDRKVRHDFESARLNDVLLLYGVDFGADRLLGLGGQVNFLS